MSIHPYRADAERELERWAERAGPWRFLKWLPNAMGIDPADPRCDRFYGTMSRLGVVLISHAGEEKAVEAEESQALGNPLRLRRALERGVKVIVAHCGSLGEQTDHERPDRPRVASFDLFLRLMDDPRYRGQLFGELSATVLRNREPRVLTTLLDRTELHPRLVNGSDYPLPVVNALISTGRLAKGGLLAPKIAPRCARSTGQTRCSSTTRSSAACAHPAGGASRRRCSWRARRCAPGEPGQPCRMVTSPRRSRR